MSHGDGKCPVDHSNKSPSSSSTIWNGLGTNAPHPLPSKENNSLSTSREVSSIPRTDDQKWIYPSEAQFYSALLRKNQNQSPGDDPMRSSTSNPADMRVIVPIHNAVNERTWAEILQWEQDQGGDKCGGVRLVSFKGNPGKLTPRARWKSLWGYQRPFDRHDWIVERCGTRLHYVIDYYAGRATSSKGASPVSFYLDVRPALDSWEGFRMRFQRYWGSWIPKRGDNPSPSPSS